MQRTGDTLAEERRRYTWLVFGKKLMREKPLGMVGGLLIFLMVFLAVFADFIVPYGYDETDLFVRLQPPTPQHWFGTDNLGRDTLTRVIYGARVSIYVGLAAVGLGILGAIIVGILSGYFGGWIDAGVQRFVDAFMCFPWILIALTIMAILGPGMLNVIITLGFLLGVRASRVVRGSVLIVKENEYVQAARALGASHLRIIFRYILPNITAPIIVLATVNLGYVILVEAALSFLGFGVPPPRPSWGGMLSGEGLWHMYRSPWLAIWPGLALSLTVFGFNMFGDALRDLLDPRLKL